MSCCDVSVCSEPRAVRNRRRLGPLANVQGGGGASALVAETLGELRAMNASCKQDEDVGILSEEQASERASERRRGGSARARARRM